METETWCEVCGCRLEDFDKKYVVDNCGDRMVLCYDCKVTDDIALAFDGIDPDVWNQTGNLHDE